MPPGAQHSTELLRHYAPRVGAEYCLDVNDPVMGANAKYFDRLRPLFDRFFDQFRLLLYLDMDIFPVRGLTENIFEEPCADIGMCEEVGMPEYRDGRKKHINGNADRVWADLVEREFGSVIPRDEKGRVRVFNSGLIMWTRDGIEKARQCFVPVDQYIAAVKATNLSSFYAIDQNYMDAMVHMPSVNFTELSPEWNRQVHGKDDGTTYDERTPETKFVHIQLSGADHNDAAWHDAIVNP
jgi:hypothetical protein